MTVYRAAPVGATIVVRLDSLTAVFHRPSGITHLLAEPAPQILAALEEEALPLDGLLDRLSASFDIPDANRQTLSARLAELAEAGLAVAT